MKLKRELKQVMAFALSLLVLCHTAACHTTKLVKQLPPNEIETAALQKGMFIRMRIAGNTQTQKNSQSFECFIKEVGTQTITVSTVNEVFEVKKSDIISLEILERRLNKKTLIGVVIGIGVLALARHILENIVPQSD